MNKEKMKIKCKMGNAVLYHTEKLKTILSIMLVYIFTVQCQLQSQLQHIK